MALQFTIKEDYYKTEVNIKNPKNNEVETIHVTINAEEAKQLKKLDIDNYNNIEKSNLNELLENIEKMQQIFFKDELQKVKELCFGVNFDNLFDLIVVDYINFIQGENVKQLKTTQNTTLQRHMKR